MYMQYKQFGRLVIEKGVVDKNTHITSSIINTKERAPHNTGLNYTYVRGLNEGIYM